MDRSIMHKFCFSARSIIEKTLKVNRLNTIYQLRKHTTHPYGNILTHKIGSGKDLL